MSQFISSLQSLYNFILYIISLTISLLFSFLYFILSTVKTVESTHPINFSQVLTAKKSAYQCALECLKRSRCSSFNMLTASHLCELSDSDHLNSPTSYADLEGSEYHVKSTFSIDEVRNYEPMLYISIHKEHFNQVFFSSANCTHQFGETKENCKVKKFTKK